MPQLELNFCPYFELNGRVDRQAVFEDDECIKKVIDLSVGATRYPNTVSAHVSNRLNFAATDLPLSRFYYFSAKFKHIVVPANGNSPAAVPILTLHGIKVTVNMNVGEDKVYQNPCVQRDLTNNQTSYFSFNDTAVCVRTVVANVESSESFDPIFADIHFTDRNGVLPLRLSEGAFSTPNVSRRGDYHLRFNMNNEERRGYMNSHDRNKTYADYFTLFDINNVASAFQLLKSGSDGLGITNLRVIAFRPSNISDESTTSNECNMYYGNRNLPGSAGDIHLYWLDNEDDEYGNHWVNAFPKQGNQTFAEGRGTTEACIASVNSLSTALNQ
ncbi:MAG: hypothetical protein ACD_73C00287G0001 [uncultured bacterium]|nr:MAG: hypothetical protein ACD_73C00287G0001 [uncultured bacterium]